MVLFDDVDPLFENALAARVRAFFRSRREVTSSALAGSVAAVALYPSELTATQIAAHYAASGQFVSGPLPPASTPFALDSFDRTTSSGWGSADRGGAWATSPAGSFAVSSAGGSHAGTIWLTPGATNTAHLSATRSSSTDLTMTIGLDRLPSRSVYLDVIGRRAGSNAEYDGLVRINQSGLVHLNPRVLNGPTPVTDLATPVSSGSYQPGSRPNVRMQVSGTAPITIRLKAWPAGSAEPTAWAVQASDTTAALQTPGMIGFRSYLSSGDTHAPVALSVGNLSARSIGCPGLGRRRTPSSASHTEQHVRPITQGCDGRPAPGLGRATGGPPPVCAGVAHRRPRRTPSNMCDP